MPDLDSWRETSIADLEVLISRLETLDTADWERDVPCAGWTVRDLAAHLTGTLAFLEGRLTQVTGARPASTSPEPIDRSVPAAEIVAALRARQSTYVHRLHALTQADYDTPADDNTGLLPPSVRMYLELATFETALHRNDLEVGLGDQDAKVGAVGIAAIDAILGSNLVMYADAMGDTPDKPLSIVFDGKIVNHTLTWDGTTWSGEPASAGKRVKLAGDDSALVRFLCGRIPASDRALSVTGDIAIAHAFKTFVPGP